MPRLDKLPVNPAILKWARESLGKTIEEVSKSLKQPPERYESWEYGTDSPTYSQLEKLAYQVFKRPLAVFFFPEPPEESDPNTEFRTLPSEEISNLAADTRLAIRLAQSYQISLFELSDNKNTSAKLIKKALTLDSFTDLSKAANDIRLFLDIDLEAQKSWQNAEIAFKNWRESFEKVGIFTFKRAFKQEDISGFCLDSEEFPIIVVNNKNTFTRQTFTLFHELAHLLFGVSGVLKLNQDYIRHLESSDQFIESSCNKLAAEILIPEGDFQRFLTTVPTDNYEEFIEDIADVYNVSREVVARKLLEHSLISQQQYGIFSEKWGAQIRSSKGKGGSYYSTQISYLGNGFINLAFESYYAGKIGVSQLAEHLNIKASNVQKMESAFFSGA